MAMAALEATVVATAMPTVVSELGGYEHYGWVGAAYLLASTITVPLYGKLADQLGRKPVMLFGTAVFLIGSVTSGLSQNIAQLIAFRALQGLGAGAMQPVTLTIVGDIFPIEERGKAQGMFGAVWGLSGVLGPLLGGLIVKTLGWRWVFYINLPFGILSAIMLIIFYKESKKHDKHSIDILGAILLSVASILLLSVSSRNLPWYFLPVSLACLVLFVINENRAKEPILPISLITRRIMGVAAWIGALLGMVMMGTIIYAPLLIQEVRGGTPTEAGSVVTPMLVAWPIAATLSSKAVVKIGARKPVLLGVFLVGLSSVLFAYFTDQNAGEWTLRAIMCIMGAGLGLSISTLILAVQTSVGWDQRGVATATNLFTRALGGAMGVGALGSILAHHLQAQPTGEQAAIATALIGEESARKLQLAQGLHVVFWVLAAVAVVNVLSSVLFPDTMPVNQLAPNEALPTTDGKQAEVAVNKPGENGDTPFVVE